MKRPFVLLLTGLLPLAVVSDASAFGRRAGVSNSAYYTSGYYPGGFYNSGFYTSNYYVPRVYTPAYYAPAFYSSSYYVPPVGVTTFYPSTGSGPFYPTVGYNAYPANTTFSNPVFWGYTTPRVMYSSGYFYP